MSVVPASWTIPQAVTCRTKQHSAPSHLEQSSRRNLYNGRKMRRFPSVGASVGLSDGCRVAGRPCKLDRIFEDFSQQKPDDTLTRSLQSVTTCVKSMVKALVRFSERYVSPNKAK